MSRSVFLLKSICRYPSLEGLGTSELTLKAFLDRDQAYAAAIQANDLFRETSDRYEQAGIVPPWGSSDVDYEVQEVPLGERHDD